MQLRDHIITLLVAPALVFCLSTELDLTKVTKLNNVNEINDFIQVPQVRMVYYYKKGRLFCF